MDDGEKILIVKTGYSEFLDGNNSSKDVSLGDVFRATVLLKRYKERNCNVTWLTDEYAKPLLADNPYIDRIKYINFWDIMELLEEKFDSVVNLEKNREICEYVKRIDAWRKQGFRIDVESGKIKAYDRAHEVLAVSSDPDLKKSNNKIFQELLYEIIGEKWNGEEYSLGYKPQSEEIFDVGLNTNVGRKWPNKTWESGKWDELEKRLEQSGLIVSRQDKQNIEILTNITNYIDWINSNKTIVTSDSLGMHLAIALKKKVIGLFGPTPSLEVYFYGKGEAILPYPKPECLPCFASTCNKFERSCINLIEVEDVYKKTMKYHYS